MADDIVIRLRNHCDTSHIPGLPCDWLGTKCFNCESADEIERLRKIIKTYVQADHEYTDDLEHLDAVPIRESWREAWLDLINEATKTDDIVTSSQHILSGECGTFFWAITDYRNDKRYRGITGSRGFHRKLNEIREQRND